MTRRRVPRDTPEPGATDPDAFVNAWVGVPFKWDGRDRAGVDCWGLVLRFYRDCLGERLPDWTSDGRGVDWVAELFMAKRVEHWRDLPAARDFALVLCEPARRPAHIGVMWRGGVLHALAGRGVVWEALGRFRQVYPNVRFGEFVA